MAKEREREEQSQVAASQVVLWEPEGRAQETADGAAEEQQTGQHVQQTGQREDYEHREPQQDCS